MCRAYFNPRSRDGSDLLISLGRAGEHISIHAPVKGATAALPPVGQVDDISIHAPVKGATR